MRKLLLMSVVLLPLILPIWLSKKASPQRGLRQTVYLTLVFLLAWALAGPAIYFAFPPSDEPIENK